MATLASPAAGAAVEAGGGVVDGAGAGAAGVSTTGAGAGAAVCGATGAGSCLPQAARSVNTSNGRSFDCFNTGAPPCMEAGRINDLRRACHHPKSKGICHSDGRPARRIRLLHPRWQCDRAAINHEAALAKMVNGARVLARRINPGLEYFEHEKVVAFGHARVGHAAFEAGVTLLDQRRRG